VLIVGNERLLADSLEALLRHESDIEVVGNTFWLPQMANRAVALNPDVVVIDFHLNDLTAADVAKAIWRAGSRAEVIFLTERESESVLLAAIEVGACAVVDGSRAARDVIEVIRRGAHGASDISVHTIGPMLRGRHLALDLHHCVTHRELEILALLAKGVSSREMAASLGISYVTVRTHLRNLASKLGAHNKLEVLAKAHRLELISVWSKPVRSSVHDSGAGKSARIAARQIRGRREFPLVISPIELDPVCA
jgi:DNA-binding NarL/FixJ family response regulator